MGRDYIVNPSYGADRYASRRQDQAIDKAIAEWQPMSESEHGEGFCSNVIWSLAYSRKSGKFSFREFGERELFGDTDDALISQVISSALVLYRLACVFTPNVKFYGREAYKLVWSANFRHQPTGVEVSFYEWKGAFTFGVRTPGNDAGDPKRLTAAQRKAVLGILDLICAPRLTHPYDDTVAGSVA